MGGFELDILCNIKVVAFTEKVHLIAWSLLVSIEQLIEHLLTYNPKDLLTVFSININELVKLKRFHLQ